MRYSLVQLIRMLPCLPKGKRICSLFCFVLILSSAILVACYLFTTATGGSLQLSADSTSRQQRHHFVHKGHFYNLTPSASDLLIPHLSTSLASFGNDDSIQDRNSSMSHISKNDQQSNLLSNSAEAVNEKMGSRDEAVKRSQEYCNIMEHSTFDRGENIPPTYTLSAIVMVVRHGDRTPIYSLPNHRLLQKLSCNLADDRSNQSQTFLKFISSVESRHRRQIHADTFWHNLYPKSSKCAAGQLTSRGFRQMINLGKALRRTYIDSKNFLHANSNLSSKIYVRTTEYVRAFQSAVGFLYGFLSNADFKQIKIEFDKDIYFCSQSVGNFSCYCPAAVKLQTMIDHEYRQMDDQEQSMERQIKEKLAAIFGASSGQIPWLGAVLEVLTTHVCHGLNLPCHGNSQKKSDCVSWSVLNKLWHFTDGSNQRLQNSTTIEKFSRLFSYPLLHEIVQRLLTVVRYNTHQKSLRIHLFSGHDKTISALMNSLGIYDGRLMPFASNLIFELYDQRKKQFYFRILYNGKDVTRQVRFCREIGNATGSLCPFDSLMYFVFYETSKYFGTSNYEEMCKL